MGHVFLRGLAFGFILAAPPGPIGLLCIKRTLSRGRLYGFVSGLGIATADAGYGIVAAFGLQTVTSFLLGYQTWLQLVGGLFLLGLGTWIAKSKPPSRAAAGDNEPGLVHAWISILFLTVANPLTIIGFLGAFVSLSLATGTNTPLAAAELVGGVFLGSAGWWLILCFIAGLLRAHLTDGRMRIMNLISGLLVVAFGIWSLSPLVRKWL